MPGTGLPLGASMFIAPYTGCKCTIAINHKGFYDHNNVTFNNELASEDSRIRHRAASGNCGPLKKREGLSRDLTKTRAATKETALPAVQTRSDETVRDLAVAACAAARLSSRCSSRATPNSSSRTVIAQRLPRNNQARPTLSKAAIKPP